LLLTCPELGVASQSRTAKEAEAMIQEAVSLFLEEASDEEIKRSLSNGAKVKKLELCHT